MLREFYETVVGTLIDWCAELQLYGFIMLANRTS